MALSPTSSRGSTFNGGTITTPLTVENDSGAFERGLNVSYTGAAQTAFSVTTDPSGGDATTSLSANGTGIASLDLIEDSANGEVYFDTNHPSFVAPRTGYTGDVFYAGVAGAKTLRVASTGLGFFGAAAVAKQTVAGAKLPSDVVLASLLTALVNLGLITDNST